MKQIRSFTAVVSVGLALAPGAPWTWAQENAGWSSRFTVPYRPRYVPPVNVSNSSRLEALLRGGNLYLSLQDAIALGVENNLDIELERYEFGFANADLLRAKAGANVQGIPTAVGTGMPNGVLSQIGNLNTGLPSNPATSSLFLLGGSLDPTLSGTVQIGHVATAEQVAPTSGSTELVAINKLANLSLTQGFLTGGTATLSYIDLNQTQNVSNSTGLTTSNVDLAITQPLLQGFGLAMNNRTIRIARNNLRAADLVFKQQVVNVVANVALLYWNLVYFNSDLEVKRRAVEVSTRLYNDNKMQVDAGTMAPLAITQAEAQVASDEQALVQSQTNVLQQETLVKSALSRNGLASPAVASAHIIVTDKITIPEVEAIEPIQDLVERALDTRPELAQSRIQLDNQKLALAGVRNQMLPSINAIADVRNNALTSFPNLSVNPVTGLVLTAPFFAGGNGNILSSLYSRNFPNYTVGLALNIPLRNRSAQANMITQELNLRQDELTVQKLINQIRVDVQTGLTALVQARAQYQSAQKARILQTQTADAEEKKLAVGASTPYNVILMQRDMWAAEDAEVQAEAAYALARVQLEWATGMTLENHGVQIEEAKSGKISRAPDASGINRDRQALQNMGGRP
jgi:outer membrane protein